MTPIFILGYMASGKTTFGRALARATGREFIDLDFYIEQRFRTSIREIFATRGEAAFREMESAMLREVGEFENVVIACGGGTPCFGGNMDYMLGRGLTIWLQASPERIARRLLLNRSRRPLMADKKEEEILEEVKAGLEKRHADYARAEIIHSGENLENRTQISSAIAAFLALHPL